MSKQTVTRFDPPIALRTDGVAPARRFHQRTDADELKAAYAQLDAVEAANKEMAKQLAALRVALIQAEGKSNAAAAAAKSTSPEDMTPGEPVLDAMNVSREKQATAARARSLGVPADTTAPTGAAPGESPEDTMQRLRDRQAADAKERARR